MTRGLEKFTQWFGQRKSILTLPDRLKVINPRMWPSFKSKFARSLNRHLLLNQLSLQIKSMPCPVIAITTLPVMADMVGKLRVARWIYYCVDDFGEWPGLDHAVLQSMEVDLVSKVDEIVVVSSTLQAKITSMGKRSTLITHGVDLKHWQSCPANLPQDIAAQLDALPKPLVTFWGVIDQRLDISFLSRLCDDLQQGTVLLVGPEDNPRAELNYLPRFARFGPLAYRWLPYVASTSAAMIMPYLDLPVTRAMQPLKLKEYLATGKPVVVRDLPACQEWSACMDLAHTPEEFSLLVRQRIASGILNEQRVARAQLELESWDSKSDQFEQAMVSSQHCLA
ncbi:MAG: hypothetical protein IT427_19370 [Pirellulales bacterium]|nr:hypothetical protein [Pirellulales bacterium]